MVYKEIKRRAEELRFTFETQREKEDNDFALDLVNFAKQYDFSVFSASLKDESGIVLISREPLKQFKNKKKVIVVNANDSALRQRFTIAHELAHYFLHLTDEERNYVAFRDCRDTPKDGKEAEADYFASNLLMPENKVRAALTAFKGAVGETDSQSKIRLISNMFLVSITAATVRLNQLGLV